MKFFLSPGSQSVPLTSELTLFVPKTIIKEGLLFPVVLLGVVGYIYIQSSWVLWSYSLFSGLIFEYTMSSNASFSWIFFLLLG